MLPNFGITKSPGGSSHEIGDNWPPPLGRLAQHIGEPDWGIHPSGVLHLIDTRGGSPNSRYVKSFVRGFRCGIAAARSSCPKLRMLSATMNRVPASIWDKRMAFVSGRLTAVMVGRGPQTATRYSTALSRSRLLDDGRLRWTQVDCVGLLSPLLTAKAP